MAFPVRFRSAATVLAVALALPAFAAAPSVTAEPATLVLGTGTRVTFTVRTESESRLLEGATSVGTLTREVLPSEHEAIFRWTPPTTRFPQVALVSFWAPREDGPPEVAVFRLPLTGRTELEVTANEPKARVRVEVAGRIFGPVQADARGHAKVPIEVPPGITSARAYGEIPGGRATSVTVPIQVPPTNPLAVVIAPPTLPPDGKGWLWVLHAAKLDAAKLQVSVQGGEATRERVEPDRALYLLAAAPKTKKVTVTATIEHNPEARAQATAAVAEPPPPTKEPKKDGKLPKKDQVVVTQPPQQPSPLANVLDRLAPAALAGGFYGGGKNVGFALALGAGYRLPVLAERLTAEAEVGLRSERMAGQAQLDGALVDFTTSVLAVPLELSARYRVWERGPWHVDARAGGGLMPFSYRVAVGPGSSLSSQPPTTDSGLGGEGFAAAQAAYRMSRYELFVELRVSLARAKTSDLDATPGGMFLAIGGRYTLSGR